MDGGYAASAGSEQDGEQFLGEVMSDTRVFYEKSAEVQEKKEIAGERLTCL
jgi:hypothetical protein